MKRFLFDSFKKNSQKVDFIKNTIKLKKLFTNKP